MTTTSRIVVGVDGSPASMAALRWAQRQAELTGSSLEAIISWEFPTQYRNILLTIEDFDWEDSARSTLITAVTEVGVDQNRAFRGFVRQGHPARILTDASVDAELLVVGSRGRSGFAGLFLGSVSQYVAAHASCPVVVVREPEDTDADPAGRLTS
jgi:nucleotide-binding universal stress UspA family protein